MAPQAAVTTEKAKAAVQLAAEEALEEQDKFVTKKRPRMSQKAKDNENTPPDGNPMQEHKKQTRKKAAAATTSTMNDEGGAAAALIAMAAPVGKTGDTLLEVSDDAVQVDSADEASEYVKSDEKSDVENQDSSEEEDETLDEELDDIINKYAPRITIKPVVFSLPFEVPYKHSTRDFTRLTSKTSFDEFLLVAAVKMETHITMLSSIGYVPSYKKPKPGPKLLDDEEA
ncbi:hypothetical protein K438DRAFT_1992889 [Mycena galopus ATCC 62051]|nr:hypothetical protein K438DRAFT_1992889 [Mycena galopus ATCC 62051]